MKYVEIYEDLKTQILRRVIAPNDAVPSEKALTIKYNVSRITAKRALNELAKEGLIYRIQGRGSFVKEHGNLTNKQLLLVLPFSGNQDLGNYVAGIQDVLKDTTWKLLSITNEEFFTLTIEQLKQNYAGAIYYPQNLHEDIPRLLNIYLAKFPLVLLDQTIAHSIIPSVVSDNVNGGYLATKHLLKNNRKKIAFYGATNFMQDFTGSTADRFAGYIKALRKYQVKHFDPINLYLKLRQITDNDLGNFIRESKIDAILAENDVTAFRLLNLLEKNHISIPQEVALMGFDNLPITELANPQLSSIGQDFNKLGASAVNLLLRQINDPDLLFDKQVVVDVKLIKRKSTKRSQEWI
ncbi:substrate-binding domain-containing protein [uncultured Lactobacillus sp.]|uniref:GntR family transcriptional regulator n=1 Tax=uncultured Lactobacillus sp. TaxID=153152 RepID=UPI002619D1B3|nr:substrate-binding domain-containing protein [uncultured Lactobacillus sp.]